MKTGQWIMSRNTIDVEIEVFNPIILYKQKFPIFNQDIVTYFKGTVTIDEL
jgi:hypothetical protein